MIASEASLAKRRTKHFSPTMDEQTTLLDDFKKCEAPHCLGNDELFNIIGPLVRDKMTAKKCRQFKTLLSP